MLQASTSMSPLGAAVAGALAGAAGSFAQNLFFSATSSLAPSSQADFDPPEPEQQQESSTQTVARRTVEGVFQRPLQRKGMAGSLVHYGFGAGWGALYGLTAGSFAAARKPTSALAFGGLVWAVSDNIILPTARLSAWPHQYPARSHAYAVTAHLVYGAATWAVFRGATRLLS